MTSQVTVTYHQVYLNNFRWQRKKYISIRIPEYFLEYTPEIFLFALRIKAKNDLKQLNFRLSIDDFQNDKFNFNLITFMSQKVCV